jgi:hypothetical protein
MEHPIYYVTAFEKKSAYQLKVTFNDNTEQLIDFEPVLKGELYAPLRNEHLFNQVSLDKEVGTLVWDNGADFDPSMLHDWQKYLPKLIAHTASW